LIANIKNKLTLVNTKLAFLLLSIHVNGTSANNGAPTPPTLLITGNALPSGVDTTFMRGACWILARSRSLSSFTHRYICQIEYYAGI